MAESAPVETGPRGADDVSYVVTLVHGTFAREAGWVKDGSALRNSLARIGNVHFDVFHWTGHNSHTARLAAGRDLARHLDGLADRLPDAKRVVIAHSHGGNVAIYAASQVERPNSLAHLACLATPFLRCEPLRNPIRWMLGIGAASAALGTMVYLFASVLSFGQLRSPPELREGEANIIAGFLTSPLQLALLLSAIGAIFLLLTASPIASCRSASPSSAGSRCRQRMC